MFSVDTLSPDRRRRLGDLVRQLPDCSGAPQSRNGFEKKLSSPPQLFNSNIIHARDWSTRIQAAQAIARPSRGGTSPALEASCPREEFKSHGTLS